MYISGYSILYRKFSQLLVRRCSIPLRSQLIGCGCLGMSDESTAMSPSSHKHKSHKAEHKEHKHKHKQEE